MKPLGYLTAAALCLGAAPALAVDSSVEELLREVRRLNQRIEQLESRAGGGGSAAIEDRVRKLESDNAALERALKTEHISANEPSLATRLKAVESQTAGHDKAGKMAEALDGIKVGLSATGMGQAPSGQNRDNQESQLNAGSTRRSPCRAANSARPRASSSPMCGPVRAAGSVRSTARSPRSTPPPFNVRAPTIPTAPSCWPSCGTN